MSYLDSVFNHFKTYDIVIKSKTKTILNGEVTAVTETTDDTVKGLFFRGGMSKNFISDKYKADVSAVVIVKPSDVAESDITKDGIITVTGIGDFIIVYADNVAGQDDVLAIPVKEK